MDRFSFAKRLAKKCGEIAKRDFEKAKKFSYKKNSEIVTETDKKIERFIWKDIHKSFPEDSMLGEEFGLEKGSENVWIIDPIDGTRNFSSRIPFFAVSIGFYGEDDTFGIVYAPILNQFFYARQGEGAFENGKRIHCSDKTNLIKSVFLFCNGLDAKSRKRIGNILRKIVIKTNVKKLGSAAIETCYVASGRAEGFFVPGVHIWDVAAGAVIAKEAGCRVSDMNGKRFGINSDSFLVAGPIYRKSLNLVRSRK